MQNNNAKLRGIIATEPKIHENSQGRYVTAVLRTTEQLFNQSGTKVLESIARHNLFLRGQAAQDFVTNHKKFDLIEIEGLVTGFKFDEGSRDKGIGYSVDVASFRSVSPNEPSINSHKITGRLGANPTMKSDGTAIFSVATQDYYTDKYGEQRPMKVEWHSIRVTDSELFQEMTELKKGSKVTVEGVLESSEYFVRPNELARTFHITANSIALVPEKNMQSPSSSTPTTESIQSATEQMVKNGELATRALDEVKSAASNVTKKDEPEMDIGM